MFKSTTTKAKGQADLVDKSDDYSQIIDLLADIEREIEDWENTHDMPAPGALRNRHARLVADKARIAREMRVANGLKATH